MKSFFRLAAAMLLLALLVGCYSFDSDDLYALPQRSQEYRELQHAVESALNGAGYSAPVSGPNRQAVQQVDLDGDGLKEVLVFCKLEGERPLRVLILRREGEGFVLHATLEGEGTAFDSVQYAQVDGEPGQEILLSRRIGEQVQQFLSVYRLVNGTPAELLSSGCVAYAVTDLDGDQRGDLFLLRANADGLRATADLYRWRGGELEKDPEASLSTGTDSIKRLLTGFMAPNLPAVFVASTYDESSLITDVFAMEGDVFSNISQNDDSGQSVQTVRNYYVYSTDIDNDSVIELPSTLALPDIPGDQDSQGQYRISWYNLNLDGSHTEKISTYHNYAEGWFFFLPDAWSQGLRVTKDRKTDQPTGTALYLAGEDGTLKPLVTVYAITGDKAQDLAQQEGRFLLAQRGDVYYAALLHSGAGLTQDEIIARFSFISLDLLPGEPEPK